MTFRTRYRIPALPAAIVNFCLAVLISVLWVPKVHNFLEGQLSVLPWIVMAVSALVPLLFFVWYVTSYAEVRRNEFSVRSMLHRQHVNFRQLTAAEVSGAAKKLVLRLEDESGRQLWLPLGVWRDEDLLMARVLRATVDRKVRIEGDPMLVRRFSGLLDSYKSWDRQQAAA